MVCIVTPVVVVTDASTPPEAVVKIENTRVPEWGIVNSTGIVNDPLVVSPAVNPLLFKEDVVTTGTFVILL